MRSQVGLLNIQHVRGLCGLPCGSCPLLRQDSICGCNKAIVTCVCSGQDARTLSRLNNWLLATAGISFFLNLDMH